MSTRFAPRHRILVAYDGTEPALQALRQAADEAARSGAGICVVTVGPGRGRVGLGKAPGQARRYLVELGLCPEIHAPVGDPATEIIRVARECGCDTILLGTRDGPIGRSIDRCGSGRPALRTPRSTESSIAGPVHAMSAAGGVATAASPLRAQPGVSRRRNVIAKGSTGFGRPHRSVRRDAHRVRT